MSNLYDVCNAAGGMTAYEWERDPKRLAFILARYQFVARMLQGKRRVLEVGCSDGFGTRLVRQVVGEVTAMDEDAEAIGIATRSASGEWPITFIVGRAPHYRFAVDAFDAVYALDVLEHVEPGAEEAFLGWAGALAPVVIFGTPSFESQAYASMLSKEGHVNCKTEVSLRATLEDHWEHVFLFGMNDTTLHTGFGPMCHYRFAVCVR